MSSFPQRTPDKGSQKPNPLPEKVSKPSSWKPPGIVQKKQNTYSKKFEVKMEKKPNIDAVKQRNIDCESTDLKLTKKAPKISLIPFGRNINLGKAVCEKNKIELTKKLSKIPVNSKVKNEKTATGCKIIELEQIQDPSEDSLNPVTKNVEQKVAVSEKIHVELTEKPSKDSLILVTDNVKQEKVGSEKIEEKATEQPPHDSTLLVTGEVQEEKVECKKIDVKLSEITIQTSEIPVTQNWKHEKTNCEQIEVDLTENNPLENLLILSTEKVKQDKIEQENIVLKLTENPLGESSILVTENVNQENGHCETIDVELNEEPSDGSSILVLEIFKQDTTTFENTEMELTEIPSDNPSFPVIPKGKQKMVGCKKTGEKPITKPFKIPSMSSDGHVKREVIDSKRTQILFTKRPSKTYSSMFGTGQQKQVAGCEKNTVGLKISKTLKTCSTSVIVKDKQKMSDCKMVEVDLDKKLSNTYLSIPRYVYVSQETSSCENVEVESSQKISKTSSISFGEKMKLDTPDCENNEVSLLAKDQKLNVMIEKKKVRTADNLNLDSSQTKLELISEDNESFESSNEELELNNKFVPVETIKYLSDKYSSDDIEKFMKDPNLHVYKESEIPTNNIHFNLHGLPSYQFTHGGIMGKNNKRLVSIYEVVHLFSKSEFRCIDLHIENLSNIPITYQVKGDKGMKYISNSKIGLIDIGSEKVVKIETIEKPKVSNKYAVYNFMVEVLPIKTGFQEVSDIFKFWIDGSASLDSYRFMVKHAVLVSGDFSSIQPPLMYKDNNNNDVIPPNIYSEIIIWNERYERERLLTSTIDYESNKFSSTLTGFCYVGFATLFVTLVMSYKKNIMSGLFH